MSALAILTYHPIHIVENTYSGSDLVALESDLATIDALGIPIRSLDQLLAQPDSGRLLQENDGPCVAITLDDGSVFDFIDRDHPSCGPQRSAATILAECAERFETLAGAWPRASTFVITSPEARSELDRRDYFGGNYWTDDWWASAAVSRVLGVESHSWDHNHPSLGRTVQRENIRGTFKNIETFAEAEAEIAQSIAYITERAQRAPKFFAYPWGEASDYLVEDYLPANREKLGLVAALSGTETSTGFATEASNRWLLPRFVCGFDWRSPAQLKELLQDLGRVSDRH